jgi:asparagine synthase (glutamine-hydrolysing)
MTAIAGVVGEARPSQHEKLTWQLLAEQRRYGSDSISLAATARAAFGVSPFRRQPGALASNDDWVLVADLRFDNRAELGERVGRARGLSDAELLLAAWSKGREESLAWIAGDFALAIYDVRERSLTLARDIGGELPLFYASLPGRTAFASMATGLRPFLGQLTLDKRRLALTAFDVGETDEHSHFEHIKRVLPGEVVRIATSGVHRGQYWNPTATSDLPPNDQARWIEEYRHVLDTAVAARVADCEGPVAAHLSSGLDSSAVTATAARLLPSRDRLIAFTSAPAFDASVPARLHRIADESEIAAETAAMHGLRHMVVRETPPIADVLRSQSLLCEQPAIIASNIAWLQQVRSEAAELGCQRVLSGLFGNATLNYGGLYVLADWVRRGRLGTWLGQARLAAKRPDTKWRGVLYNSFSPWLPTSARGFLLRTFLRMPAMHEVSFLRPEWVAVARAFAPPHRYGLDVLKDRIEAIREFDSGALRKGWQAGDGMDERDPLSDRRLIEFSLTIPPEQLYWNGVSRPLARAALADRLPPSVLNLKMRGLQGADWARRFTRDEASALLEEISASPTAQDLLDLFAMRRAIERWPTDDWNRLSVSSEFRVALIGALATGMFALVHEQRCGAKAASAGRSAVRRRRAASPQSR